MAAPPTDAPDEKTWHCPSFTTIPGLDTVETVSPGPPKLINVANMGGGGLTAGHRHQR